VPSTSTECELIGKGIDPGKISLFPRGVDTVRFHPAKRNVAYLKEQFGAGDGPKILYVGRISKEKDLSSLANAFKKLIKTTDKVELVLVGDGPYTNELKELLAGTPSIFTGYREGEELATIYASCDLFAFPSATDTFGNVVLEAQASGLPVIVSDSGGPQENIIRHKTGEVIPAGDTEALLQSLNSLLADRTRLKEMGKAARLNMENRSYERAFDGTWRIYERLRNPSDSEPSNEAQDQKAA
jgi:glycosyltransferase involved in cell wall biosynthesis